MYVEVDVLYMACTRLRLNFSLQTAQERKEFLDEYLKSDTFRTRPPTDEEVEMMGNYILWGKNPDTNVPLYKEMGVDISTKHNTWTKDNVESLDELMESPTFNEAALSKFVGTQYRTKKEVFSREEALRESSPELKQQFIDLFNEIDKLDLQIQLYELAHGKRTKEIRKPLLDKFTQEDIDKFKERVSHWNQYRYLSSRHNLVDMRREQYTLRDSFKEIIFISDDVSFSPEPVFDFDAGIPVFPLGLNHDNLFSKLVFRPFNVLVPSSFTEEDLAIVSKFYWEKKNEHGANPKFYIDFANADHLAEIFIQIEQLEGDAEHAAVEENLPALLKTLHFYVDQTDLTDIQVDILHAKLNKKKNVDIAEEINKKYGTSYSPNYISTIFRQKVLTKIAATASYHEQVIANIYFPEEFKTCTCCGETMLRIPDNFMRRSRSNDGLSSRCKKCEKKIRDAKTKGE